MSDSSNSSIDDSSTHEDTTQHSFIIWLVDKIHQKYNDDSEFTAEDHLSKLSTRILFYQSIVKMMEEDPLYIKIQDEATSFMDDNEELVVKEKTAMKYSLDKYKELLLEDIRGVIYDDEDSADQSGELDIADDASDNDKEDESNSSSSKEEDEELDGELPVINGQLGGGNFLNYRKRKRSIVHNKKFAKRTKTDIL